MVTEAKNAGATVVTGGKIANLEQSFHFEPTLLTGVSADMNIMKKEVFGPVLPIQAVEDLDEAIRLSNDSDYGLTSSIFTSNINSALKAARELQFGETYVNRENFEAMQGFHGLLEFTETHVVYIQG